MAAPSVNIPNAHASVDPVVEPVAGRFGVAVDGDPTGANPITLPKVELLSSVPFPRPP